MPIYQYVCDSCDCTFEEKQGFHDDPQAVCPHCEGLARRVFYPTPIIFKGGGFYVTDNRQGSDAGDDIKSDKGEKKTPEKVPDKVPEKKESREG